jgi:hypothetical protein
MFSFAIWTRADATVKFMIDAMAKAGCTVGKSFFTVEECEVAVEGGFRPPDGVCALNNDGSALSNHGSASSNDVSVQPASHSHHLFVRANLCALS